MIRYEELYAIDPNQARATSKEYHDGIVENLVDNLEELEREQLFDQIQIYQRDRTILKQMTVSQQKFFKNAYTANELRLRRR